MRYAKDGDADFGLPASASSLLVLQAQVLLSLGCATVILRCLQQFKIADFLVHQPSLLLRAGIDFSVPTR